MHAGEQVKGYILVLADCSLLEECFHSTINKISPGNNKGIRKVQRSSRIPSKLHEIGSNECQHAEEAQGFPRGQIPDPMGRAAPHLPGRLGTKEDGKNLQNKLPPIICRSPKGPGQMANAGNLLVQKDHRRQNEVNPETTIPLPGPPSNGPQESHPQATNRPSKIRLGWEEAADTKAHHAPRHRIRPPGGPRRWQVLPCGPALPCLCVEITGPPTSLADTGGLLVPDADRRPTPHQKPPLPHQQGTPNSDKKHGSKLEEGSLPMEPRNHDRPAHSHLGQPGLLPRHFPEQLQQVESGRTGRHRRLL
ncbi:uncharacterized protein [Ambystoma mexicanum]|uniref:uncharacterized protein n=1 Tax=Ambystoma mexicanum TaxID=8296 RepID=UPI0037E92526